MPRWVFAVPGVQFARSWRIGNAVFRPAGDVIGDVEGRVGQVDVHASWAVAHEVATEVVARWSQSSTVEAECDALQDAERIVLEAMAVLRFLMRQVVRVNVDIHRIGLEGEVTRAVREYLMLLHNRVAPGWTLVDSSVGFKFDAAQLNAWESDASLQWLCDQLACSPSKRSASGRRTITSLTVLDEGFLSLNAVTRVVLYAVAVEVLLSGIDGPTDEVRRKSSPLKVAARAAYLTCGNGCAVQAPACPYVLGFAREKHLWETAKQWAAKGEWRCSAFLEVARPADMEPYFKQPSLFGARNEAVHEGRTSLDDDAIRGLRALADRIVRSFIAWVALRPDATVEDLDREVLRGAAQLGHLSPAAE